MGFLDSLKIDSKVKLAKDNVQFMVDKGYLPQNQIDAATTVALGTIAGQLGYNEYKAK